MNEKPIVSIYKPKVFIGGTNKYDLYLTVEWGLFKKTVKLSKESSQLPERVVDEISNALLEALKTNPYEVR